MGGKYDALQQGRRRPSQDFLERVKINNQAGRCQTRATVERQSGFGAGAELTATGENAYFFHAGDSRGRTPQEDTRPSILFAPRVVCFQRK
jgi:hypothetical protein